MTLRSLQTRTKLNKIGVYDITEEDELVEETSRKFHRKFDSPENKKTLRALDKYDFLCFFAKGPQIERKELDKRVIDVEVSTKEVKSRCELNGYGTDDLIDLDSDVSHGRIGSSLSASSLKLECD